jgi:hypothetical protein
MYMEVSFASVKNVLTPSRVLTNLRDRGAEPHAEFR